MSRPTVTDCLIGAVAIRAGVSVLHADSDFGVLQDSLRCNWPTGSRFPLSPTGVPDDLPAATLDAGAGAGKSLRAPVRRAGPSPVEARRASVGSLS